VSARFLRTSLLALLASAFMAASTTACGGASPEVISPDEVEAEPAAPPVDPWVLVPVDTVAIARADLVALRRSPYWDDAVGWIDRVAVVASGQDPEAETATGARPNLSVVLERADTVLVAASQGSGEEAPELVVFAAVPSAGPGDLVEAFSAAMGEVVAEQHGRHTLLRATDGVAAAELPGVWVIGPEGRVRGALEQAETGRRFEPTGALRTMMDRVSMEEASLAVAAEATPWVKERLASALTLDRRTVEGWVALGGRLEAQTGLNAEVLVETGDLASAQSLGELVQELMRDARAQPMLAVLGLHDVLDAVQVRVDGAGVILTLEAEDALARRLVDQIGSMLMLYFQAEEAGVVIPPNKPGGPS
jgi:hypothetical protein